MAHRILHIIDDSSAHDALTALAALAVDGAHRVLCLGHRDVSRRYLDCGGDARSITTARSLGWADPTGWLAVRRAARDFSATHLHAWGAGSAVAAATVTQSLPRVCTLGIAPTRAQGRILRTLESRQTWAFVATSSTVARAIAGQALGGAKQERLGRIRPGISMAQPHEALGPRELREALGIAPDEGPVLLAGGEGRGTRLDFSLWVAAILVELFPKMRMIVRLGNDPHANARAQRFANDMLRHDINIFVDHDWPWASLCRAADMMIVASDGPISVRSILHAMAAGTPVIGTANEDISELIEHGHTGLLAYAPKRDEIRGEPTPPGRLPRTICSRIEEFMGDSTLRWPLTDRARADVYAHFRPAQMRTQYATLYASILADPKLEKGLQLPPEEVTAADRIN